MVVGSNPTFPAMKIFVVTDTHLGHQALITWGTRPEGFTEQILNNIAKTKGDMIIHCGDICIGNDTYWNEKILASMENFKHKILIRGNHDPKSDNWYLNKGWTHVCYSMSIERFGKHIFFSHIPVSQIDFNTMHPKIDVNVHGHLHGDGVKGLKDPYVEHRKEERAVCDYNLEFHRDAAPELWKLAPVKLETLIGV